MSPDGWPVKGIPHYHLEHQHEHNRINEKADNFTHPVVQFVDKSYKTSQKTKSPHLIESFG